VWRPADVCATDAAQNRVVSHMTATARPVGGSLRHEVDVNGRHTISTDEPVRLGGTDTAPAPHELLAAMVAACVSTMISMYARARGWALDSLSVDVAYDPETTPRHAEVIVHLPAGLSEDQVRRLRRVAETCPARRALEAGFTFDERLVFEAGAEACAIGS
jgi:putative redox protein